MVEAAQGGTILFAVDVRQYSATQIVGPAMRSI